MRTDRQPYFLAAAQEWWDAAGVLRARGVPDGDPTLMVWREAAWCHLLVERGLYAAVVARLRAVVTTVTGVPPPRITMTPVNESAAMSAAAELFAQLRAAVSARHPLAFGRPAAA